MDRGEFDQLPGSGHRLDLADTEPGWWARRKIEEMRSQDRLADLSAEIEHQRDRLWTLSDEATVRREADLLNSRILALNEVLAAKDRLAPADPEEAVRTWRRMYRLR